jgi:hypothetical protein
MRTMGRDKCLYVFFGYVEETFRAGVQSILGNCKLVYSLHVPPRGHAGWGVARRLPSEGEPVAEMTGGETCCNYLI